MAKTQNYTTTRSAAMSIFVIGLNHKTAPVALRERVHFAPERWALCLQELMQSASIGEAVLLSTCNRTEIYLEADGVDAATQWFATQTTVSLTQLSSLLYVYQDTDAVTHLMSVACGLDSMVLGEPQILGQLKEAYSEACSAGSVGAVFHRLFPAVFNVAKEIRSTTAIGACPVSVASAAVHFAKQHHSQLAQAKIAILGAGDTGALLMRYLKPFVQQRLQLMNRSLDKAVNLAKQFEADVHSLDQLTKVLTEVDVLFSSTGSALPIVTHPLMKEVLSRRNGRSITFIDIAVPRDIDPAVATLPGVSLYCIDDFMTMIEAHRQGRAHAADKARELVQSRAAAFMHEENTQAKVNGTIRAYRGQIEAICRSELDKARDCLAAGIDPATVLEMFANAYTRKLLHTPSVQLRQAGVDGRFELLHYAKQLFSLSDPEIGLT